MTEHITLELVEEIDKYGEMLDEFSYSGEGYLIKKDGDFIGLIKGEESYDGIFYIDEIRLLETERLKGYGKQALSLLKKELNLVGFEGVSVPESKGFWREMGATFYDRCYVCAFNTGCKDKAIKETRESCWEYDKNYFRTNVDNNKELS